MRARALPGGVAIAALAFPEFSLGAGDLSGGEGFDGLPEPVRVKAPTPAGQRFAPAKSVLAGVRYAPIIALDYPVAAAAPTASQGVTPDRVQIAGLPVVTGTGTAAAAAAIPAVAGAMADRAIAAGEPAPSFPADDPAPAGALRAAPSLPTEAASAIVAIPARLGAFRSASVPAVVPDPVPASPSAKVVAPAPVAAAISLLPGGAGADVGLGAIAAITPSTITPAQPVAAAGSATFAPRTSSGSGVTAAPSVAVLPPVVAPAARPKLARSLPAASDRGLAALDAPSQLIARVDGQTAGTVDFQQTATGLAVRLGSIVDVLAERYDTAQLARIRDSSAGNAYLSLAELQAQGVPISYDPVYDEFNVGLTDTRPQSARKVHIDQISTPERGIGAIGVEQVRPNR